MANTNSFSENLSQLTAQTTQAIEMLAGMNEAMSGETAEVKISDDITLPSFSNVVKRLERAENTISKFVQGKGIVETDDGTFRKVKVSTISRPPETIGNIAPITEFSINPNWFFESLQYPRCIVKLDLTDKIDPASDRVYVTRVILDSEETTAAGIDLKSFYAANIQNVNIGYTALIKLLENNGIPYKEDRDEVALPLTYERFKGEYGITDIRLLKDEKGKSQQWVYLDNINYTIVDENGQETSSGLVLNIGDYLRYNYSLYKIVDIAQNQKRVRLDYAVGYETIGIGDVIELYNAPFADKEVEIGIGINEIDIVYVKGINEEYNLLARNWSAPISFYTNDLVFSDNSAVSFKSYYVDNVADFGQNWIAQIKEGQIYSFNGKTPIAPVLNADDMSVVQINTQLDATLDKETYNKLTIEIASTKSNIAAVRHTISSNKDLLIQSSSEDDRTNIQNLINNDTTKLNSLTTQYNSLVDELNTLLVEAGVINYSPKYHIRGFFGIPAPRYTDETNKSGEQRVISFEIMYRYLHTDETGVKLESYEYTDTTNNIIQTGVFTDWNIYQTSILAKVYNSTTGVYEWTSENPADGSQININQIDIPIRSGEKVEIKARSISEAGYPYNPLKSEWSNSIIMSFPDNLTSDDNVTTMLDTVKNDMTAVVLQETMSAAGVYTHLADSNSTYKHTANNIGYTDSTTDPSTNLTTLTEMSVQNKLDAIGKEFQNMMVKFTTMMDEQAGKIQEQVDTQLKSLITRVETVEKKLAEIEKKVGDLEQNAGA